MSELTVRERLEVAAAFDMVVDVDPYLVIQAIDAVDAAADRAIDAREEARRTLRMSKVWFVCGLFFFAMALVQIWGLV